MSHNIAKEMLLEELRNVVLPAEFTADELLESYPHLIGQYDIIVLQKREIPPLSIPPYSLNTYLYGAQIKDDLVIHFTLCGKNIMSVDLIDLSIH
jgi:hypothetical protein